jgi:hypothetical protein
VNPAGAPQANIIMIVSNVDFHVFLPPQCNKSLIKSSAADLLNVRWNLGHPSEENKKGIRNMPVPD